MSSFNVTANSYLRNLYTRDRNLVNNAARGKVSVGDLGKADTKALSKGIDALKTYDYESDDKKKYYDNLKAFADAYNYTMESGKEISENDNRAKSLVNDMKKLESKYGDELERYGITFDKKGYMKINTTAADHISPGSYKALLGEDSEFLSDLSNISKKLSRRINYLV